MKIGETYDFLMKPTFMIRWKFIRETKKCYCVKKEGHAEILIPKKQILQAYEILDNNSELNVTTGVKQESNSRTEGFIKGIILL